MPPSQTPLNLARYVASALFILIIPTVAYFISSRYPDHYYLYVQEDEFVEWATFWGFFVSSGLFLLAAVRENRETHKVPWFSLCVALFCLFVAMEEISWGQRLFGYLPPDYFLRQNFQQELNLHNLPSQALRKWALKGVIAGYGILLPLASLLIPARHFMQRIRVVPPPVFLIPAFLATLICYIWYPLRYSGEWVELMLGLCFFFVAVRRHHSLLITSVIVISLGFVSTALSRITRDADPQMVLSTLGETEALRKDFLDGGLAPSCGLHKRIYTYVGKYGADYLWGHAFSKLTRRGMPRDRARFFLDPWNMPYWVRHECSDDGKHSRLAIYSFGPNRQRDSTQWDFAGDDIGVVIDPFDGIYTPTFRSGTGGPLRVNPEPESQRVDSP